LEPLHLNEDPLTLEFKGLGNFRNQVLFVSVEKGPNLDRLKTLADLINQHFIAAGLTPCDSHQVYSAHMTVMKLSRMKRTLMKKFKPRKINPELYSQWADTKFGSSIVKDIQLLQMSQKDENGFYKCISKINVFGDGTSPGPTGSMYTSTPCNKEGQRMEHESATSLGSSKIKFDEPSDAAMTEDREELVMEYSDTLSQMNNEVQVEAEEPQTGVEQVSGQTKNSTEQALISDLEAERGNCLVTDREDVMKKLTECVMAPTTEETNAEESMQVIEITGNEEIIKQQESTEELVPQYVDAMSTEEGVMHPPTENIEIETENQTGIAFAEAEERMNAVSEKVQIVGEVKETEDDVSEYQSEESALDTAHPVTCVQAEVVKDAANSKDEMTVSGTVEELCEEVTIQESSDNAIDTSNIISDLTSEETATGMVKELRNEVICQEAEKGINITEDSASEIIKQTEQALNLEGEETSAVMVEELQTEIAGNNADEIGNTECNMNQTSDQLKGMSESKVRETAEILAEEELHKDVSCPIDDQIGATENGIEIDQVKTKLESAAKQTLTGIVTQFDEGMTCPETDEPVNLTEHQPDKANNQNETVKTALTEMVELHDEVSQGDLANIVGESKSQSSNESLMELNSVAKKLHEVVPCSEIDEPVDIMEHQTGKANNHNQIESLESMIKAAMVELHEDETSQGESASVVEESKHQASNTGEIKVTETDASESLMASNSDAGTDQSQVGDIKPAPVIQDDMTDSENYDDIPETGEDFIHLSFKETEV
jgi:2'-5' RNA ligase